MREGLRVAVLEKGLVGGGATAAGMGHLVAMDDSPAQLALTKLSLQLWRGLLEELPASAEYRETGTLWIAADEDEMAEVRRKYERYNSMGLACEILDGEALAEEEPELRRPLAGALRVLGDGGLSAGRRTVSFAEVAERGALIYGPIREFDRGNVVTLGDGTRVSGGYVVNAAGCSAVDLNSGFVMRKRKGHLIITDRYPDF
jgi:glycine/D-amino acid oxidase-like deaminating enzyme